jgi:hypothetical protein
VVGTRLRAARQARQPAWIRVVLGAGASWDLETVKEPRSLLAKRKAHLARRLGTTPGVSEMKRLTRMKWGREYLTWDDYEFARFISENDVPPISHFFLHLLCKRGLVDSIITTNYDCYWESAVRRAPDANYRSRVVVAPRVEGSSVSVVCSASYDQQSIRYWKIHGSFGILYFPECGDYLQHPPFTFGAVSPYFRTELCRGNYPDTFHDFKVPVDKTHSLCGLVGGSGPIVHFIDTWSPSMVEFKTLLKEARTDLTASAGLSLLLTVGFRCGKQEELSRDVKRLSGRAVPTVMLLHQDQRRMDPRLRAEIERHELAVVLHGNLERNMHSLVRTIAAHLPGFNASTWPEELKAYDNWESPGCFMGYTPSRHRRRGRR